ncbi:MAG: thiamine-phosphate kinase, partial [Acidobacteriota bacterium]|nr:thiamine-phosphate kinase [Acidobacteriota bacterium]
MNEFDLIHKLKRRAERTDSSASSFTHPPSSLICGIGDDAAVIRAEIGKNTVVTTDLLVEEIDFRRDTTRPDLLGHKALAVSLSDIAAMGARPRWALVSIGLPKEVWRSEFVDGFYEGFFRLADRYDVTLIGGDVSRTPERIVIDSIVIGESTIGGAIFRSGAQPGDQIFVTGYLGDAAAGLRLIEQGVRLQPQRTKQPATSAIGGQSSDRSIDHLLLRHLQPEPRVGWGLLIGDNQLATAMIDISDGLSSDLNHLCRESKVGALFDASRIPIDHLVTELCGRRALDPLMLALHGGEDFELLFTVKAESVDKLPTRVDGVSVTRIGEITDAASGIR